MQPVRKGTLAMSSMKELVQRARRVVVALEAQRSCLWMTFGSLHLLQRQGRGLAGRLEL